MNKNTDETIECDECEGAGDIDIEVLFSKEGKVHYSSYKCKKCDGNGIIKKIKGETMNPMDIKDPVLPKDERDA